jgi:hypothetical protein
MPCYYFDLRDGGSGLRDEVGMELPDGRAAVAHGYEIAGELMRHNEAKRRYFCLLVRDETNTLLFRLPFSAVDNTLDHHYPEIRALAERWCENRRNLAEALYEASKTLRQSRALIARSRGKPYLCAENGETVA